MNPDVGTPRGAMAEKPTADGSPMTPSRDATSGLPESATKSVDAPNGTPEQRVADAFKELYYLAGASQSAGTNVGTAAPEFVSASPSHLESKPRATHTCPECSGSTAPNQSDLKLDSPAELSQSEAPTEPKAPKKPKSSRLGRRFNGLQSNVDKLANQSKKFQIQQAAMQSQLDVIFRAFPNINSANPASPKYTSKVSY